MGGRFLITGLPRSRTAWFAVACATATSVCFHEPTARLESFDALREFWAPRFGVDIGISDSCLVPLLSDILDDFAPRTLIVERQLAQAMQSFRAYAERVGLAINEAEILRVSGLAIRAMEQAKSHRLVKTVSFDALDDYDTVLEAMRWLLPDREFPDLRTLMTFNVQVSSKHIRDAVAAKHSGWHREAAE